MKQILCSLIFAFSSLAAVDGERFQQSEEAVKTAIYGHIDAKGLKALIDSHTPVVILDARGENWHDGNKIPGAELAFYTDTPEKIAQVIPYSDSLVVIYCYSFNCPLSPRLAQYLVDLGYTNVIEYPAGLKEWRDIANYPVETMEK